MGHKVFTIGEVLSASDVNAYLMTQNVKVKTNDETVNNSTTFQADDHLVNFPLVASTTYRFMFQGVYETSAVADFKFRLTVPAGATIRLCGRYRVSGTISDIDPSVSVTLNGDGAVSDFSFTGWITTSTTAGNLNLDWAQNTAEATNTILRDGTTLHVSRI